ncbi:heterokaryon incompatibility protein-domain-containing protein [Xylaria arbuscula]|nr:heterokaryon incompatibility protein-domain-containing protein [Xylaria arbuscula]
MAIVVAENTTSPHSLLYSPLDPTVPEIRVIKVLPCGDTENEQVSCLLGIVPLSDDTRYAALSYVWGDPRVTEPIMVNGITLHVTTNLASALKNFSKHRFPKREADEDLQYLWVDAICINQHESATSEQNHQVALMSRLYANAASILSWLGPANADHIDVALGIVHNIASVFWAAG